MMPERGYPRLRASRQARIAMTRWLVESAAKELGLPAARENQRRAVAWSVEQAPRLRPGDDAWAWLPQLAEGHGLLGQSRRASTALPDAVARSIEAGARRVEARDARLRRDYAAIRRRFEAQGLPCAAIKGTALLEEHWTSESGRPRADLDLLVPDPWLDAAGRALEQLGYAQLDRSWKHRRYLRPDNHRVVDARGEHPDNPRPVELHPRLVESFRGIEWDRSDALTLDRPFTRLPVSLLIAHLAAHASVDALQRKLRAQQLLDLARLLRDAEEAEVERMVDLGRGRAAARFLWPSLSLVDRFVTPLPASLAPALAPDCSPALLRWLEAVDPDALGYFGREDRSRALLEVPRIWPISSAERRVLWRFILWPRRAALADRYPRLANSAAWPLIYPRHLGFTALQGFRRWRRRGRRA